ncbi:hypothetical protein CJ030_MR5G024789 [Morella rubra]|uniref:Uncharacterized protein n=1 Tax=Morella rubra TaxID=262757 RepID=A0A6A1VKF0_9ROSI|nr:hypothetical protein CJ030_MR5G024789 [Morella rubra]
MQRPIGAFPAVKMENKPSAEDVFRTLTGQDMMVIGSFLKQNFMLLLSHFSLALRAPCVYVKEVGAIEDQMGKMSENPGDGSTEPATFMIRHVRGGLALEKARIAGKLIPYSRWPYKW